MLKREQDRREALAHEELRRQYDARLKAELERKLEDKTVTQHREHICTSLLSLTCPRCKRVFHAAFDGCFALWCSGEGGCGCAFCAYCLRDCGSDAHAHVAACPFRPKGQASGDEVRDRFCGTQEQFQQAMIVLRTNRVRAYWHAERAELPTKLRSDLPNLIKPLLVVM